MWINNAVHFEANNKVKKKRCSSCSNKNVVTNYLALNIFFTLYIIMNAVVLSSQMMNIENKIRRPEFKSK